MENDRDEFIRLRGVRQNNLKDFDLDIPLGQLTVVTGLSGSGKSSLVFETLHAEGQRRYVETFSPYTRQFLEIMDRPDINSIENIRPSIAIQQTNTVKTSRSTVGTMTELCDFFKTWFCHVSELFDPETGKKIESDSPETIWKKCFKQWPNKEVLICFNVKKPKSLEWNEVLNPLIKQGYIRCIVEGEVKRLEALEEKKLKKDTIKIVQDRILLVSKNRTRFLESARMGLHFGDRELLIFDDEARKLRHFSEGLRSPSTGKRFEMPTPALFSFNSPIGACPECRGFGRTIDIDYNLVIPDKSLTIREGVIKPFHGEVFGESLFDLLKFAPKLDIRTDIPWRELTEREKKLVIEGDPEYIKNEGGPPKQWYGIQGFFEWLESKTYKMHIRFLLSRYRSYKTCDVCHGKRLQPNALNWKWLDRYTLPDLYEMSVRDLYQLLKKNHKETGNHPVDLAADSILTRLNYLNEVGLGYLTLNRTSRTLSGGEVERVNLTACLGTCLVDTLFVLDEPSVGLHSRDIDRLVKVLRRLTDLGNTVIVVEHDEAIMCAADNIIEIGPEPGSRGGHIVYSGPINKLFDCKKSITASFLKGEKTISLPVRRRSTVKKTKHFRMEFKGVTKNNISNLNITIPLKQFVCLTGVSGSGKSTLLNNVIYQGLLIEQDKPVEDPAVIAKIKSNLDIDNVVLVDQSPISKTPRSNSVLYIDAWDSIRQLFAGGLMGKAADMKPSNFSFNSGSGRCEHCHGLGYEKVEMQFLSDVYVTCPVCEGKRFKAEILDIKWNHKSVTDILEMDVVQACEFFKHYPHIQSRLSILEEVGLGYLTLGQPLNTLSGGESQRLKLVKYLSQVENSQGHTVILLDEPTTGLHRGDIQCLLKVLQKLVNRGHSLIVIEHQMDVIKSADWIIELGPDAGDLGGRVIAEGTPEQVARMQTASSSFLREALNPQNRPKLIEKIKSSKKRERKKSGEFLDLIGAREHNLKNISVSIPHRQITVLTGVSGSGKSSLAFDIIFAEGQRRFMESVSAYARQYIEQMSRPDIDLLTGISPTVAIEQRVTRGTGKSTVGTVTEVAQYLRLLYARIGIQYSPKSGNPVVSMDIPALTKILEKLLESNRKADHLYLCAPLVIGRKGHHEPIANWAQAQGFQLLRIDGKFVEVSKFKRLDRYKEHDIELIINEVKKSQSTRMIQECMTNAIEIGKGSAVLVNEGSQVLSWFSTKRADPITGEAFPELDPKHFSWNSPKGWCPTCHGHGRYYDWMRSNEDYPKTEKHIPDGAICPDCHGERLNIISRNVRINTVSKQSFSLPELMKLTPSELLKVLNTLELDNRDKQILKELLPQITERLEFMDQVGLEYLSLDRSSSTLSGGEAQRIRLASQLSSNLSGVLYVLDEPSIGLHARDNAKLIESLKSLKNKGNTLLVVEHDDDTMREADLIIDLGPGAGIHGGEVLACGKLEEIIKNENSLTGKYLKKSIPHPLRGSFRPLPNASDTDKWLVFENARLRNLKGETLRIPIGCLIQVCGISGAGKSTMIRDLLKPCVAYAIEHNKEVLTGEEIKKSGILESAVEDQKDLGELGPLINGNRFKKVIEVDQEPIGKTLRSTPATYIGAFDIIRDLYASLPEAKIHGFTKSHFSFNTRGGRCERCQGSGRIKLEMNFLPDTFVTCEQCNGDRYGVELEDIRWNGKNIAEALKMSFEEGAEFFKFHSRLKALMELMIQTGLGYLTLGQSSPTLSGGEAQRLKLVTELAKGLPTYKERRRGISPKNLYILEEPTIGLHLRDCERLIGIIQDLVDQGHTVIVIEHNLDLIAEGDYLVEIGPEGGEKGGQILYQGPVQGILKNKKSPTASFLKGKIKIDQ